MAYSKTKWKDHIVEKPNTYSIAENSDGTVTQTPAFGSVIQEGTPLSADHLNHMEEGIEGAHKIAEDHTHDAAAVTSGILPIAHGGTGASTAKAAEFNISGGIKEASDSIVDESPLVFARTAPSATSGVFYKQSVGKLWEFIAGKIRKAFGFSTSNILPIANGGTGATTAADARNALGAASSTHSHTASVITSGTLPIARGGTGAATADAAREALGITASAIGAAASSHNHSASNVTSGTLPIARGGTGAATAAAAREAIGAAASSHNHSASNVTSGTLPITRGGTGAATAAAAREALGITPGNIGALSTSGGTVAGNISIHKGTEYSQLKLNRTISDVVHSASCYVSSSGSVRFDKNTGSDAGVNYLSLSDSTTSLGKPLDIKSGGTGATTAAAARANLGAAASNHTHKYLEVYSGTGTGGFGISDSGFWMRAQRSDGDGNNINAEYLYMTKDGKKVYTYDETGLYIGTLYGTMNKPTPADIGAVAMQTATVTLAAASWSSLKQTVNVSGVTSDSTVIVTAHPASHGEYMKCGVYCSAQGSGTLTFTATKAPTTAIKVNILILK